MSTMADNQRLLSILVFVLTFEPLQMKGEQLGQPFYAHSLLSFLFCATILTIIFLIAAERLHV